MYTITNYIIVIVKISYTNLKTNLYGNMHHKFSFKHFFFYIPNALNTIHAQSSSHVGFSNIQNKITNRKISLMMMTSRRLFY